ncbi:MAG: HD domain-containing protein [Bdellovibrionales bacterium]|nr:HD domain-containing protein [Bdellovibrionales bacterium]MCB0539794.1 HD domain-containing protein [Bacteroidota bacterium]
MSNLDAWEKRFKLKVVEAISSLDPAHDLLHFQRVVNLSKNLCQFENANLSVVLPAAWLHDLVIIPKNDPKRNEASRLSADAAIEFLKSINYTEGPLDEIHHAICAHSFSANIPCETLEAKIIQDADRLDGIGAIGIARCFATSGLLKRQLYAEEDPLCENREPDDLIYTLDHFYKKLFKVVDKLHTKEAQKVGRHRLEIMKTYVRDLYHEIEGES